MLTTPDAETIRAACKAFDDENGIVEQSLRELFGQYPGNRDLRHVLLKVVAVNSLYSTQIFVYSEKVPNVVDLACHIHRNGGDIDSALASGSPVDIIAQVTVAGKRTRNHFSFASKYCSWHRPEFYPILGFKRRAVPRTPAEADGF